MSIPILVAYLGACAAAASTGALFRPGAWYQALRKPSWTPPNWLFPLAWTALYMAIAVAAWRVARSPDPVAPLALAMWTWQIALNAVWSPVFFGLHRLRAGLVILVLLWTVTLATTLSFAGVDVVAGWLMLVYLAWITYALALNLAVWRRNPAQPSLCPDTLP